MEVFIHEDRRRSTMIQCLETVKDNIGVNIGVNASRRYAVYGDSDSDSDRVRCFKCLASTGVSPLPTRYNWHDVAFVSNRIIELGQW